MKLNNF